MVAWLIFTSAIAYVMETTGVVAGWWTWQIDEAPRYWSLLSFDKRMEFNEGLVWPAIPDIPVWGWPIFAAPLAFLFLSIELGPFARFGAARRVGLYAIGFVGYFGLLKLNPFPAIAVLVVAAFFVRARLTDVERARTANHARESLPEDDVVFSRLDAARRRAASFALREGCLRRHVL